MFYSSFSSINYAECFILIFQSEGEGGEICVHLVSIFTSSSSQAGFCNWLSNDCSGPALIRIFVAGLETPHNDKNRGYKCIFQHNSIHYHTRQSALIMFTSTLWDPCSYARGIATSSPASAGLPVGKRRFPFKMSERTQWLAPSSNNRYMNSELHLQSQPTGDVNSNPHFSTSCYHS